MVRTGEMQSRRNIVEVCRRVHARGWLAATDGNATVILPDGRILATPTGVHKGFMSEQDLILIDRKGRVLQGSRGPSSEIEMHLAVYEERPDVFAVLHAHPTNCVAFSLAGISLAQCLLPEVVFTFGSIPTVAYTTPTTREVPEEVRRWIRDYDALILDRHGSLTVGSDVFDAYNKLERMEHVAEITYRARALGTIRPLSCEQVEQLRHVGRGLGLPERKLLDSPCEHCNACAGIERAESSPNARPMKELVSRVQRDVNRVLAEKRKG